MTIRTGQFNNDEPLDIKSKGILNAGAISGVDSISLKSGATISGVSSITFGSGTTFTAADASTTVKGLVKIKDKAGLTVTTDGLSALLGQGLELDADGKIKLKYDATSTSTISLGDAGIKIDAPGVAQVVSYTNMLAAMANRTTTGSSDILKFGDLDTAYDRIRNAVRAGRGRDSGEILLTGDGGSTPTANSINLLFRGTENFSPSQIKPFAVFPVDGSSNFMFLDASGVYAIGGQDYFAQPNLSTAFAYMKADGEVKLKKLTKHGSGIDFTNGLLTPTQRNALVGLNDANLPKIESADAYHKHDQYALASSLSAYVPSTSLATTLSNYYTKDSSNARFQPIGSYSSSDHKHNLGTEIFTLSTVRVGGSGGVTISGPASDQLRFTGYKINFNGEATLAYAGGSFYTGATSDTWKDFNARSIAASHYVFAPNLITQAGYVLSDSRIDFKTINSEIFGSPGTAWQTIKAGKIESTSEIYLSGSDPSLSFIAITSGVFRSSYTRTFAATSYINSTINGVDWTNSSQRNASTVEFRIPTENDAQSGKRGGSNSNYYCDIVFATAHGSYTSSYADIAEMVPLSGQPPAPGDVLEVSWADESVDKSTGVQYSLLVAGIVSSEPGVVLGVHHPEEGGAGEPEEDEARGDAPFTSAPVALAGRVPCKVTTKYIDTEGKEIRRPIKKGFMLVSSSIPGHAMAADPSDKGGHIPQGTVLGKAMQDWDPAEDEDQEGVIKVWVNLC